jgi:benzoate 4-monooxygenase
MALLDTIGSLDLRLLVLGVPTIVVIGHVIAWLLDPHSIRHIPGPFLAKFTDLWLGRVAANGHRSEVVHKLHQQYGACYSSNDNICP